MRPTQIQDLDLLGTKVERQSIAIGLIRQLRPLLFGRLLLQQAHEIGPVVLVPNPERIPIDGVPPREPVVEGGGNEEPHGLRGDAPDGLANTGGDRFGAERIDHDNPFARHDDPAVECRRDARRIIPMRVHEVARQNLPKCPGGSRAAAWGGGVLRGRRLRSRSWLAGNEDGERQRDEERRLARHGQFPFPIHFARSAARSTATPRR